MAEGTGKYVPGVGYVYDTAPVVETPVVETPKVETGGTGGTGGSDGNVQNYPDKNGKPHSTQAGADKANEAIDAAAAAATPTSVAPIAVEPETIVRNYPDKNGGAHSSPAQSDAANAKIDAAAAAAAAAATATAIANTNTGTQTTRTTGLGTGSTGPGTSTGAGAGYHYDENGVFRDGAGNAISESVLKTADPATVGQWVDLVIGKIGTGWEDIMQYIKDHPSVPAEDANLLKAKANTTTGTGAGTTTQVPPVPTVPKGNGVASKGEDPNKWYDNNGVEQKNKDAVDASNKAIADQETVRSTSGTLGHYDENGVWVPGTGIASQGEELIRGQTQNVSNANDTLNSLMGHMVDGKWVPWTTTELMNQAYDFSSPRAIGSAQDVAATETQRERSMGLNAGQAGIGGGGTVAGAYQASLNDAIDKYQKEQGIQLQSGATALNAALGFMGVGAGLESTALGGMAQVAGLSQSGKQFFAQLEQNADQFIANLALAKKKLEDAGSGAVWESLATTLTSFIPFVGPVLAAGLKTLLGIKQ